MMNLIHKIIKSAHTKAVLALISAACVLAYNYYYLIEKPYYLKRLDLHLQILHGTAPSPYLYRDLIPFLADLLLRIGRHIAPERLAFAGAYLLLDFIGISLILICLYFYLLRWFRWELSLAGALFCAAVLGVTSHEHYYQPWSFWEAGFFTLGLLLILQKRMVWLGVLVALAAFNRETGLFIPLVYLAVSQDLKGFLLRKARLDWKKLAYFAGYLAIWGCIFIGLRLLRGNAVAVEPLDKILTANLDAEITWKIILNIILFQGVFWLFAGLGYRKAPEFVRRTVWIVLPYLVLLGIWSYWIEVRLLMPFYAICIPLGISYLNEQGGNLPVPPVSPS